MIEEKIAKILSVILKKEISSVTHYGKMKHKGNYNQSLSELITFVEYNELFLNKSWEWLNNPLIKKLTNTSDFSKENQIVWYNSLKNREDYFVQGVKVGQTPVGVWGFKNIMAGRAEYFGYIGEINFWGRGIGKNMLKQAIKVANYRGIKTIYLTVLKDNLRAISLYKYFNFIENNKKNNGTLLHMELKL